MTTAPRQRSEVATPIDQRTDNWIALAIGVLVLLVAVPGAVMGTGFLREDWWEIDRFRHCGRVDCPGSEISSRPLMVMIYHSSYGLFNNHPSVLYWILNVVLAVMLGAVYLLLRRYLRREVAIFIAALWAILPTHLALQHWAAEIHIDLSLMFTAIGLLLLARRPSWKAIAPLVLSIAIYEATFPLIFVALLVVRRLEPRRKYTTRFTVVALAIVTGLAAVILALQIGRTKTLASLSAPIIANFELGEIDHPVYLALAVVTFLGIAFAVARLLNTSWRTDTGVGERLVVLGIFVMVVGASAFMTTDYDSIFRHTGDRGNAIVTFGTLMIWAGIALMIGQKIKRPTAAIAVATVALIALGLPVHLSRDSDYSYVFERTRTALHLVEAQRAPQQTNMVIPHLVDNRYGQLNTTFEQDLQGAASSQTHSLRITFAGEPGAGVFDPLTPLRK